MVKRKSLVPLATIGVVLGGVAGEYLSQIRWLSWLDIGARLGLTSPLALDLGVIKLTFALSINFTLAGLIGVLLAFFIYRKL